jgi:hypothetical protein
MDNWDAHEPIGSRVWLMVPKWDTVDFAEEAAFVLSLAQDLIEPQEERFEVGLVSMCGADAVVVKAIVERPLIDALKQGKLGEARKLICTHNALKDGGEQRVPGHRPTGQVCVCGGFDRPRECDPPWIYAGGCEHVIVSLCQRMWNLVFYLFLSRLIPWFVFMTSAICQLRHLPPQPS